ncbi:hypothetical protein H8B15_17545 [Hymenobacter sp. BT507]|uniref:DUF481 domain-containing protein n=1 Tax=Hymenobacter citatus TaxID=2763506 RepID=A0ABR7MNS3_9BACT|nr:hypothetical protein [Hymenobacter citatus]MBC6612731.1 hypothetical protein [Hymenobacter citatus]
MTKSVRWDRVFLWLVVSVSLSGCVLYTPLRPSAPMLREKGQAEVGGGTYLFSGRLEGSAAYSPVRHVVVRTAGALRTDKRDTATYSRTRQLEVGTGTYWALGQRWLVGGSMGYGWGHSSRGYQDESYLGIFRRDSTITYQYDARYGKPFGDVFVAYEDGPFTMGMAYRLSQVRFTTLTNNGQPIRLRRMTRNEPMLFMRFGNRQGVLQWAQLQLTLSSSWSADLVRRSAPVGPLLTDVKAGNLFTSIGIVVYPHRFKRERY